ncbi:MAG: hypothetical protein AAF548_17480, partial [Actinomycetota bacterium]
MPRHQVRCPPDPAMVAGFERIREQLDVPPAFPLEVEDAVDRVLAAGPTVPPGSPTMVRDPPDHPIVAIDTPGSRGHQQAHAPQPNPA